MALLPKMLPWLAPVDLASHRFGVEAALLFAILDRESACATSPYLDKPGPSGTGDPAPRRFSRYAKREDLSPLLRRWIPSLAEFRKLFPFAVIQDGDPLPTLCRPIDGRGWGRGAFQIDFAAHTAWCLEKLPDGRFVWEDPAQNADKAASILHEAIVAFDHDEYLAACAYNAGISNVRSAILRCQPPVTTEMRHMAGDGCTTGRDYGRDVMRRRREFRRLLKQAA